MVFPNLFILHKYLSNFKSICLNQFIEGEGGVEYFDHFIYTTNPRREYGSFGYSYVCTRACVQSYKVTAVIKYEIFQDNHAGHENLLFLSDVHDDSHG